jgi:hypothetical protein
MSRAALADVGESPNIIPEISRWARLLLVMAEGRCLTRRWRPLAQGERVRCA